MSKRRISKQQNSRIQKIQADFLQSDSNSSLNEEGIVLTRYSRHAQIETTDGKLVLCSIRPHIDSLVAGDRVIWQTTSHAQGIVVSRYPRNTVLGRPDKKGQLRPVAANISQLMIIAAVKPEISWPLLDSYLVMAEHLQLEVCIILNKVDLPCKPLRQELITTYSDLGYKIQFLSKEDDAAYLQLEGILKNHTSVFVGQSGVGKSSIISRILPHEENIQTAEISSGSELGCHTTSNSRLYHLPLGGKLIDSPGVREFGLWQMPAIDVVHGFREFRNLHSQCKFRNCNHIDAPGCAIVNWIHDHVNSQKRYENMIKIITQRS